MNTVKSQNKTGFEIYKPLLKAKKRLLITTYGLSNIEIMKPVLQKLNHVKYKLLIVGYSRTRGNLKQLTDVIHGYRENNWSIRVLPDLHIKLWIADQKSYIGSCNFVKDTNINHMAKYDVGKAEALLNMYLSQTTLVSDTTSLFLIPKAKRIHVS